MDKLKLYLDLFFHSGIGQALLAFLRVALATLVALWMDAGLPISDLTWATTGEWAELAIQAGATLVIVNYFAPWERRYGVPSKGTDGP